MGSIRLLGQKLLGGQIWGQMVTRLISFANNLATIRARDVSKVSFSWKFYVFSKYQLKLLFLLFIPVNFERQRI